MSIFTSISGVKREINRLFCGINGVNKEISSAVSSILGVKREIFSNTQTNYSLSAPDEEKLNL